MTNFFEHQAAARRRTAWLVVYFALAVLGLVLTTYLLVTAVFVYPELKAGHRLSVWEPGRLAGVGGAVLALVGGCSVYKVAQLSGGGRTVALMLGGRELSGSTRQASERRLLNVVEEMSIASGVPMPPVYVLDDEEGINAFAAGYAPGDAVVAVSRGCLEYLTRDELQGVVAHEFSHILNGDMRLNIRLMGVVFGIVGLSLIGYFIMRASGSGSSRDSKGRGQLVILGLGLYVLGSLGAFFGSLIKAAASRQREYLADASAVQFTRNPEGIGGALMKIGGLEKGPNLDHPSAPEASHMFFADALTAKRLSDLLATHPPLDDRIRRVLPRWDGTWPEVHALGPREAEARKRPDRKPPLAAGMPTVPGLPQVPFPVLAEAAMDQAGVLTPGQTVYAAALLAGIPDPVREAVEEPFGARAVVYGLLLDPKAEVREGQLARLKAEAEPAEFEAAVKLSRRLADLPDGARLPLLDLAVPALRRMSPDQYRAFRAKVDQLIHSDRCVSTFEFVLGCVLERHLDASFGRKRPPALPGTGTKASHVGTIMSLLAWEGHETEAAARKAYEAGLRHFLRASAVPPMLARTECGLDRLEQALAALARESLGAKRRLLLACAACIAADRETTVREAELYRAVGDMLGCPIPPLPPVSAGLSRKGDRVPAADGDGEAE